MKHFLQQMKRDALAPPRRAWAMRHWALSLLLLVMLQFVGSMTFPDFCRHFFTL